MSLSFLKSELTTRANSRDIEIVFDGTTKASCKKNNTEILEESSSITLEAAYNECGININVQSDSIVYNQTVRVIYGENPDGNLVFRSNFDEYHVQCSKPQVLNASSTDGGLNVTADSNASFNESKTKVIYLKDFNK